MRSWVELIRVPATDAEVVLLSDRMGTASKAEPRGELRQLAAPRERQRLRLVAAIRRPGQAASVEVRFRFTAP
jgi:hypothetical protein